MAGLQQQRHDFDEEGARIFAASADDRAGAEEMKRGEDLDFPVMYGLDVDDVRERFGLYVEKEDWVHLQPAQLVVRPDSTVRLACYSSGKVGRLDAEEALDIIRSSKGG